MTQAVWDEKETAVREGYAGGPGQDLFDSRGDWQEAWFGTPGDVDDFIFYGDQGNGRQDGCSGR